MGGDCAALPGRLLPYAFRNFLANATGSAGAMSAGIGHEIINVHPGMRARDAMHIQGVNGRPAA